MPPSASPPQSEDEDANRLHERPPGRRDPAQPRGAMQEEVDHLPQHRGVQRQGEERREGEGDHSAAQEGTAVDGARRLVRPGRPLRACRPCGPRRSGRPDRLPRPRRDEVGERPQRVPRDHEDHREVRVGAQRRRHAVTGEVAQAPRLRPPPHGPRGDDGEEGDRAVAARVLREPDVVVAHRQEQRREQRLAVVRHEAPQGVQRRDGGDPEEHRREPHRPRRLAEGGAAEVRQHRVQRVVVVAPVLGEDHPERGAERPHEGVDLVDPQSPVHPDEAGDERDERGRRHAPPPCGWRGRGGAVSPRPHAT